MKHIDGGTPDHPFQCPQCRHDGHPPHTISSVTEWSNHVELTHGILYTPVVKPLPLDKASFPIAQKVPTRPLDAASTKRKREPSFPGVLVLSLSGEKPRKKARGDKEKVSPSLVKSESLYFSDTPT